jgi:hypothetical protein
MPNFIKHGVVLASTTPTALPDVPFTFQAWLKPRKANTAVISIGTSALTTPGSTTDATSGMELDASALFCLQGPGNLSNYYVHSTSTGQLLTYFVEG